MPDLCFPSFLWKEVPRRGGGWLVAFLSLGQPLALRAFPFQRKGIDEDRFLLSNFKWNKPPSVSSFRAQSRNPSCPRTFWLLSWKYSHFPLSYLRRHTGVQDRSLDFVRDDVTRISLFSHLMTARSAIHIRGASDFYAPHHHSSLLTGE